MFLHGSEQPGTQALSGAVEADSLYAPSFGHSYLLVLVAFSDFTCFIRHDGFFPSHAVALTRDSERLGEVKRRINVLPLGR